MSTDRYLESAAAWRIAQADRNLEVLVAGTPVEPDPARLALVRRVVADLPGVARAAANYLDEFVDRGKFASGNEWWLEGVGSTPATGKENEFSLQFSIEGDTYGMWTVTFRRELERHWPVAFSRHNY